MKLKNTRLGFTLIELLVVITIIGILATGAVSVYTSQIQKARDSVRLTDITAIKAGIEQFYQDNAQYPYSTNADTTNTDLNFGEVTKYTPKLPSDPKTGQSRTNAAFEYVYTVGADSNTIIGQIFEVSTTFEQEGSMDKAVDTADGGNDSERLEIGISLDTLDTDVTDVVTAATLLCVSSGGGTATTCSTADSRLVIKGNP